MSKLDELMKASRGIAAESMGAGRAPVGAPMHGASPPAAAATPDRLQGVVRSKSAAEIPLAKIGPDPDQPREEFDPEALRRLADSLRTRGQLQPIRVRWDEARSQYVIVCGERRWRAAEMAGLQTMSCVIMDGPISPGDLLALQMIENLLREDLKPVEQARAFKALMDRHGWSTRQVAQELAITQSNVVRALALLELPEVVQEQIEQGALPPATAYEVSKVEDPDEQAGLAARVVSEGMSRAETVEAVRETKERTTGGQGRGASEGRKITSRVFRGTTGKVSVELRKGTGDEAIVALLREVLGQAEARLAPEGQAAA